MPAAWHFSRIDTLELKSQIEKKVGRLKAEKYFDLLTKFLNLKISKPDFDRLCTGTIGGENIHLHNNLLRAILKNACLSKTSPPKDSKVEGGALSVKVPNGSQTSSLPSLCREFPLSPRKGRTPNIRDRKFKDRPSPLGPYGKSHGSVFKESPPKNHEQQSATELFSLGSRPPGSVEDGEEVDQAYGSPVIHSRSPVRAPLGIPILSKSARKVLCNHLNSSFHAETCHHIGELPDTSSLWRKLEQKLATDGMNVSVDSVNLLNIGLDVYLKRLIKPCLDLASSRSALKPMLQRQVHPVPGSNGTWPLGCVQKPNGAIYSSMSDFRVAMELNPSILGVEWPMQLEKVCLRASEE